MIFNEVNGFFALIDRFFNSRKKRKMKEVTSVPKRFVELFEAHGVRRNQIPRFFGNGIVLDDLADDLALLKKLSEPVLAAACSQFGVRREWLDSAGEQPYAHHDFYKAPENFQRFIEDLKDTNPDAELTGYLIVPEDSKLRDQSVLILEESIGVVGETVIYRYHFCDDWMHTYWKSRAYLSACVAIAWKRDVYIKGRYADNRDLSILTEKEVIPGAILNRLVSKGRRWYAEDLVLLPTQYLEDVNPEVENFGLISALRLWLQLDEDGWMDAGLEKSVREIFRNELAKYEAPVPV